MDIGKYKVKKIFGDIETHDIFLDNLSRQKDEESGFSEKKLEVGIKSGPIYFIFALFFIFMAILFTRTFYFQIIDGKKLHILSQNNKGGVDLITPERGIIYDKNLNKIVVNSPAYDLLCDKRNMSSNNQDSLNEIAGIAQVLGKNPLDLENQIASSQQPNVLIAPNVDQQTLLVLEAKMNGFPDCQIQKNTVRDYLMGPVFSDVLGYTGKINSDELESFSNYSSDDSIGKTGLEKFYEPELRGVPGKKEIVKNAMGQSKGDNVLSQPQQGYNLVLNIDEGLQKEVYDSLEKSIQNIGAKKGAAVALDPKTGAVLAMVSYPSYDDNLFSKGISQQDFQSLNNDASQPLFNRAISAHYPTGSIIKPLEAAAALQENLISPDKQINDPGYILVPSQYDPSVVYRFGGVEPHGLVDMRKAIAVSSNIYFYTVGGGYGNQQGLGPARIKKYLSFFGWDNKTGIDMPGEYSGFIPSPGWKLKAKGQPWYDGDTYNLSIGQSDLQTTPLQVANAYAAIANGGTLYQPQIVNRIISGSGSNASVVKQFAPEVVKSNFIDPQYLQIVREGMRDGVDKPYGLSSILNNLPVEVAAKTGTAQISSPGKYNLWSAAFAPYNDPQIVIVVTAESVNGLGAVTLPVAHDVLQYYFTRK